MLKAPDRSAHRDLKLVSSLKDAGTEPFNAATTTMPIPDDAVAVTAESLQRGPDQPLVEHLDRRLVNDPRVAVTGRDGHVALRGSLAVKPCIVAEGTGEFGIDGG